MAAWSVATGTRREAMELYSEACQSANFLPPHQLALCMPDHHAAPTFWTSTSQSRRTSEPSKHRSPRRRPQTQWTGTPHRKILRFFPAFALDKPPRWGILGSFASDFSGSAKGNVAQQWVPEPSTGVVVGGAIFLPLRRRRRRQSSSPDRFESIPGR